MSYEPGSQDSEVLCESKLPGVLCTGESRLPGVLSTGESRLPGVLCTGESFFVFFNLQAHAASFKAALIQKTVKF